MPSTTQPTAPTTHPALMSEDELAGIVAACKSAPDALEFAMQLLDEHAPRARPLLDRLRSEAAALGSEDPSWALEISRTVRRWVEMPEDELLEEAETKWRGDSFRAESALLCLTELVRNFEAPRGRAHFLALLVTARMWERSNRAHRHDILRNLADALAR